MLGAFELPFMQRAALVVALIAPLAGLLGAQIVLRRLAFFTHGVGAATFPGLVLAGPAGLPPALAALGLGGAFATSSEWLGRRARLASDAGTALLLVLALAAGIVLASDVFESGSEVDQLLFGSLLAIGNAEVLAAIAALLVAGAAAVRSRRDWIAAGFDPAGASALGLRTVRGDRVLLAAIAVAVVACVDSTGALLVSALLVVPAATARLFARSVAELELASAALALSEGLGGLTLAHELDVPPGAAIAVLSGAVFALAAGWRMAR